jgi:nucleoside-diphosphate-sugar epimerase
MDKRRYLVTGGAGFIGSHIVEALVRRGDAVAVLDDFSTGHRKNLDAATQARAAGTPVPEIFAGDLRDAALVRRAVAGATHVLHQAALPSVPRSVAEPLQSHEVNASGTLGLLLAARDAGVKRFVYASSSSAYGDVPTLPKIESQPTAPLSPYAVSKLAGEQYCRIFTPLYGLETVSLRYFNIFGPRQDPQSQYAAVIPRFVTAVDRGESPIVYGDGQQSRDFTYIDNAVQANLLACDAPASAAGLAYNVACGTSATLLEVLDLVGRILGKPVRPKHEPPRAGDVKHSLASIDLARRHLGFEPKVGLEEGLRRTVAAFAG